MYICYGKYTLRVYRTNCLYSVAHRFSETLVQFADTELPHTINKTHNNTPHIAKNNTKHLA